ncbi:hypothetical protein [Kaistella yonginensis]|mgnify:CR=1 FL=1|uniref:hypothetical protein n=1 Tax=Kaistella yonginensis TaxID=658267 RepID=UPI0025B5914C|nr:hypothetical protein [Kaistella yonginensis]MDN3607502.1 hypothetical protein [Kaistella yonginensis]
MHLTHFVKSCLKSFAILFVCFSLTSCFDILDKVNMRADGSGEYSLILNASKSKTRLASISKMETINGKPVPKKAEIQQKVADAAAVFKTVPGISNVQTSLDFQNYIIKLSCNFKNIANINAGIERLKDKKIIGKLIPSQLYAYHSGTKTFTKNKINTYKNDYEKLNNADKEIFNSAKYTTILQFENSIKSQTNKAYSISPNKKALKLEGNVLDFILQKKQFYTTIIFN